MALFADGSMWHGGKQYERRKDIVNEEIKARIERMKERAAQINREWEAIGWKVVRYWEEELKDWRAVAERLSKEIWRRLDWLKAEIAGAHEVDRQSEEEIRRLKEGERDIQLERSIEKFSIIKYSYIAVVG